MGGGGGGGGGGGDVIDKLNLKVEIYLILSLSTWQITTKFGQKM